MREIQFCHEFHPGLFAPKRDVMTWRIPNTILAEVAPASYEKPSIHGAITN